MNRIHELLHGLVTRSTSAHEQQQGSRRPLHAQGHHQGLMSIPAKSTAGSRSLDASSSQPQPPFQCRFTLRKLERASKIDRQAPAGPLGAGQLLPRLAQVRGGPGVPVVPRVWQVAQAAQQDEPVLPPHHLVPAARRPGRCRQLLPRPQTQRALAALGSRKAPTHLAIARHLADICRSECLSLGNIMEAYSYM